MYKRQIFRSLGDIAQATGCAIVLIGHLNNCLLYTSTGVSNIEITDANIKAFESTAKKYGIDFALKKADDRYLVFFKGRDADVLTAAFREFSKKKLDTVPEHVLQCLV